MATNSSVVINFIQYIAMVNQIDEELEEELEYDKRSKEDKAIIDSMRKARDMCILVPPERLTFELSAPRLHVRSPR
ncbi:hypothetical protein [Bradyrhizobium ivorense]|uniref:hypothetical protein n=1 Tax=Bradyrhizobium ivorense TaxID=2511166 RepID=UPI00111DB527|nr:hypothetical protein [Bradyrhizobium ivorense]